MEKGKPKERTWYVFTYDALTNQAISRELPAENTMDGIMCVDGVARKLWMCDGSFVTKIIRNKVSMDLHFDIYKKEGKNGAIKKVDFLNKKKKKKVLKKKLGDRKGQN